MGTLNEDLTAIKTVEDTLTGNKVANFSYTNCAYNCNCADGVETYDVNAEQNIPVACADILNVNDTVLTKGYRAQASSVTRMLLNHFLGRTSYNLNKVNDVMSNLLTTLRSHLGTADGLATLDENGRLPYSQLPESALEYKGNWNANLNSPTLVDGVGTKGDFYIVSVAGTQDFGHGNITFFENDRVIYDGSIWSRLSAGDVKTVNNVAPVNGNITLTPSDLGLGNVDNTADATKCVCCACNAKDSTCFGGCTYAQAKADIQSGIAGGTVCIANRGACNANTPVALCTGATTVGKSTSCGLNFNTCTGVLTALTFCGSLCGQATRAVSLRTGTADNCRCLYIGALSGKNMPIAVCSYCEACSAWCRRCSVADCACIAVTADCADRSTVTSCLFSQLGSTAICVKCTGSTVYGNAFVYKFDVCTPSSSSLIYAWGNDTCCNNTPHSLTFANKGTKIGCYFYCKNCNTWQECEARKALTDLLFTVRYTGFQL